jgi:hypothetical protein
MRRSRGISTGNPEYLRRELDTGVAVFVSRARTRRPGSSGEPPRALFSADGDRLAGRSLVAADRVLRRERTGNGVRACALPKHDRHISLRGPAAGVEVDSRKSFRGNFSSKRLQLRGVSRGRGRNPTLGTSLTAFAGRRVLRAAGGRSFRARALAL